MIIVRYLLTICLFAYALQDQAQAGIENQPLILERYEFLGDGGEVLDKKTKLIWKRCAEGETWIGGKCSGIAKSYTWTEAMSQFGGEERKLGGNWHLPDIDELISLRKCSKEETTKAYPWCEGLHLHLYVFRHSSRFWSATPHISKSGSAMAVRFDASIITESYRNSTYLVRLVRR